MMQHWLWLWMFGIISLVDFFFFWQESAENGILVLVATLLLVIAIGLTMRGTRLPAEKNENSPAIYQAR
jgi:hypothetical protein